LVSEKSLKKEDEEEKKKEINASKIYSPSGKFAERAKKIFLSFIMILLIHCQQCGPVTDN